MYFKDLPPRKDPKGGSPKTPFPPVMAEYPTPHHVNGSGWKTLCGTLIGLLGGMIVAWFTAFIGHGMTQKEVEEYVRQNQQEQEKHLITRADLLRDYSTRSDMHEYVDKYSLWAFDKPTIIGNLARQDQNIGELRTKIDLAAKFIEQQQQVKR